MKTRRDHWFELTPADEPCVTQHKRGSVSLHLSLTESGDGFCVELLPCHLPVIERLAAALRTASLKPGDVIDPEFKVTDESAEADLPAEPATETTPA